MESFGDVGQWGSYAQPAIAFDALADKFKTALNSEVDRLAKKLERKSAKASSKISTVIKLAELNETIADYSPVQSVVKRVKNRIAADSEAAAYLKALETIEATESDSGDANYRGTKTPCRQASRQQNRRYGKCKIGVPGPRRRFQSDLAKRGWKILRGCEDEIGRGRKGFAGKTGWVRHPG